MLFNSLEFLIFFAVLAPACYLTAPRFRPLLLAAASLYFYAAFRLDHVPLLIGVSLLTYAAARAVGAAAGVRTRRTIVAAAVTALVAILAASRVPGASGFAGAVGLSFYTLSAISYVVDVHRGDAPLERHPGHLTLYLAFFPKLLAGPIERAGPFLVQTRSPAPFNAARVTAGLQLMLWGLFKKVVIADRLAVFVDTAYRQPSFAPPADLVLATYFFAFQLYCDFSGYSDMAIGAAKVLGLDLTENFRRPFLSTSVAEFWSRRWHISLAGWLRDYVYIPLGGGRVPAVRKALNIVVVFVVSGLWHGAASTFAVWGALNGLFVAASQLARKRERAGHSAAGRLLKGVGTFHLVLITWVFFRADSLADAWTILVRTARAAPSLPGLLAFRLGGPAVQLSVLLIILLLAVEALDERRPVWDRLAARSVPLRWAFYYALVFGVLILGTWDLREFVYMQF